MRRHSPSVVAFFLASAAASAAENLEKLALDCQRGKAKDCAKLVQLARTDKLPYSRARATSFVTDQAVLAELARKDSEAVVRTAAVERLSDDSLLAEVARADRVLEVRVAAVRRLTDQRVLSEFAADRDLAEAVAKRSTDPVALARILRTASDAARLAAIESPHFADQAALAEAALDGKVAYGVRSAAFGKLDPSGLVELVARASSDADFKKRAENRLESQLDSLTQADLAKLAVARLDWKLLSAVTSKINDQAMLADVILKSTNRGALEKLTDPAQLARVARLAVDSSTRATALARMAEPPGELCNAVLLQIVKEGSWYQLERLWDLGFTLSPDARESLRVVAARGSGFGPNAARALLAGLKSSSWARLRSGGDAVLRSRQGESLSGPVPPGIYSLEVGYESGGLRSSRDIVVRGNLRAGRCYVVTPDTGLLSNSTTGLGWSARVVEEPCKKPAR